MKNIINYMVAVVLMTVVATACENEPVSPILGDSKSFISPELMNDPDSEVKTLLPEEAQDIYEEFEWSKADYGVKLPTNYLLAVDTSEAFTNPVVLESGPVTSAAITVESFNNALLKLGLPGFEEATVKLRVMSVVTGGNIDTLKSKTITRRVVTYQDSDCGDFCTIGLIGSATPGGWGTDTDMRIADPERKDLNTWTLTVFLKGGGEVKFRAGDDWGVNWGGSDFPTGTGTQDGPNIPIPADGYYKIVFNDQTGNYSFTVLATKTFTTVGIIGSATPGGWGTDTDLTQDTNDPHVWTGEVTLTDGEVKFRAENDWADNWGNETYPSGYGIGGGPNIPVKAGTYFVWFNDATGEYAFMNVNDKAPYTTIGIIGTATPGGWDTDSDLIQDPSNPYKWSVVITLSEGEAKFRADNDWTNNWGGVDLPAGIGIKGGPNINVKEGKYFIRFHSGTGEYSFLK